MEKYFWFIGIIFGPFFGFMLNREFRAVVERQPEWKPARRFLVLSASLLFSVPYILIGICQLLGGFDNPGFVLTPNIRNPWVALAIAVLVLTHVAAFLLLRKREIAELISRLSYVDSSPSRVRFVSQLIIVASLVMNLLAVYFGVGAR
jgi:hypothetical protein